LAADHPKHYARGGLSATLIVKEQQLRDKKSISKIKKCLIDPSIGHFVLQNSFISQYLPSPFDLRAGNHYLQFKADSVRASGLRSVFHADPLGQAFEIP
jgi:hypothetical protein